MKNYPLEIKNRDDFQKEVAQFILHYEIENIANKRNIIIHYGNGNVINIPYSAYGEMMLLEKMKNQVLSYQNIMQDAVDNLEDTKIITEKVTNFFKYIILSGVSLMVIGGIPLKLVGCFLSIVASYLSYFNYQYNKQKNLLIEDYEKNRLFLDNEILINEAINDNMEILNINSIDKMSLQELKNLLDGINYHEEMVLKKHK